jgi:hypothetical protein
MSQQVERIDGTVHRLFVWTGPVVVAAILIGCIPLGHFLPAPSPTLSGHEIAELFAENQLGIRVGCLLMMTCFALFATWAATITVWIRKMEPGFPVLTYSATACVGVGTVMFELIPMTWAVASFRADSIDPDITRTLNDWTWFVFLYTWPPFSVWLMIIAIAILRDKSGHQYLPRWVAYQCIWVALLIAPAGMIAFTKTGPLAFNGWLALWVPFAVFFLWMVAITVNILKAIKQEELTEATLDRASVTAEALP